MEKSNLKNPFVDEEFFNQSQIHMPSLMNLPSNIKLVKANELNLNSYGSITPHNVKQGSI